MTSRPSHRSAVLVGLLCTTALSGVLLVERVRAQGDSASDQFHDSHFHLTNYIQQGIDVRDFLKIMGTRVGRSTLFGIPLQQQWSFANSADFAPTYYLHSDAPLYYYSFTDAYIASVYRRLSADEQARLDPMITGFNPADMYGVDHIRRVLQTFPGVFTGIGEFSIHKEFVSAKISGETASLTNPALDRILDFAAESGLVVILHNDIDMQFGKADTEPVYLTQTKALLKRHPKTTLIWAHTGLGRIVRPVQVSAEAAERPPTHLEIRSPHLHTPDFYEMLDRRGLGHALSHWTWLPPIRKQLAVAGGFHPAGPGRDVLLRLLTPLNVRYADAYAMTHPFDRVVPEIADTAGARMMVADTVRAALKAAAENIRITVLANNRAWGNAPALTRTVADAMEEAGLGH